ncbi:MAG: site-specific integrase [Enhydrobacter sp.]|nr:MAG: site-specific integrase [Enhydrobacter sp.]
MTVYRDKQRKSRWCYEFVANGVRYRGVCKSPDGVYARTKADATAAEVAARARAKAEQGMARSGIRPGAYLLGQALLRHIGNQLDSSASHVASLRRIMGELLRFFGPDRAVVDIGVEDIDAYRKFAVAQKRRVWIGGPRKVEEGDEDRPELWRVLDRPRSASEVNHCLDCLRSALRAAHAVRDPRTGERVLPFPPEVKPVHNPGRDPTPMPEAEFSARLAGATPWVAEAASLARLFGLRLAEALMLEVRHLDHEEQCIRLRASETKSGKDQPVYGGDPGWQLLLRLASQARRRGQTRLVTWPGPKWHKAALRGDTVPEDVWRPLKSIRKGWLNTAVRGEIDHPHRFHDLRAGYITGIAKLGSSAITKRLARHASMATTERYIAVAADELARAANRAARRRALRVVK